MFIRFFKQVAPNGDLKRRYSWQKSTSGSSASSGDGGGIARRSTAAVDKDSSAVSRLSQIRSSGERNPTAICTSPTANSNNNNNTSSSICGATTNDEADRLDIKLQEDGSTVQTVDLVADCPEPANADVTILPVAATPAAAAATAAGNTKTISPSNSDKNRDNGSDRINEENIGETGMGQRSSSLGLLRPKISLTWVLRDQPHLQQQQQYQRSFHNHYHNHHDNNNSSSSKNNNNNDLIYANSMELSECKFSLSNNQRVQDVRAEIHTQNELVNRQRAVKEREVEKERMFRRSVKSVKSVKSLKSMKNAKKAAAAAAERARTSNGDRDSKENHLPNAADAAAAALNRIDNIEVVETCFENVAAKDYELEKRAANASKNIYEIIAKSGNEAIASSSSNDDDKVKRAISEPNLNNARDNNNITSNGKTTTTASTSSNSGSSSVGRHNNHRRKKRPKSKFGYAIADLDSFLTKASIEQPANIPVVLTFPTTLYQTQGGTQAELALPLGCVVNAVFKNQAWLYVQTAHGQEGYVNYTACLPLGILPQSSASRRQHCWDDPTDVFPRPLGNLTDMEKLQDTRSECGGRKSASSALRQRRPQSALPTRNPKSSSSTTSSLSSSSGTPSTSTTASRCPSEIGSGSRGGASKKKIASSNNSLQQQKRLLHTLLLVRENYQAEQQQQPVRIDQTSAAADALTVNKGEVVLLLGEHRPDADGRYRVRAKDGREGYIPAAVAAHGFL